MKPDDPLHQWHQLVQRAQPDVPPDIDASRLVRSLPALTTGRTPAQAGNFIEEFSATFSVTRPMLASLALAALVVACWSWQSWSTWDEVSALTEVVSIAFGGVA